MDSIDSVRKRDEFPGIPPVRFVLTTELLFNWNSIGEIENASGNRALGEVW